MKNKLYLPLLLLLICITANSQTNVVQQIPEVDSTFTSKLTGEFFFEKTHYNGSQFFNKDWVNGDILLSNGQTVYNKSLKYSGLIDELLWLNNSNYGKFKLDRSLIQEFWLKNITERDIHFKRINVNDTTNVHRNDLFAEVKVEGKYSFYIQHKVIVTGYENVRLDNAFGRLDNLKSTSVFYIKLPSNHYFKMKKLRRRAFLKQFPDDKKAIAKLIGDNHLNVRNESDFVRLIELMNQ